MRMENVQIAEDKISENDPYLTAGNLKVNRQFNEIFVDGHQVILPNIEYRILRLMMQYPGKIFSVQNLYESVWDEPFFYNYSSTVMVHIRKLRMKVEEDSHDPKLICTIWGKGYKFEPQNQSSEY